jgi:hypothetical protein
MTKIFRPLDPADRQTLAQLLTKSRLASSSAKRESLCAQIEVDPTKLEFLQNASETDFSVLLVEGVHGRSDYEAIEKLIDFLLMVMKGLDNSQLKAFRKKIQPHPAVPKNDKAKLHLWSRQAAICYSDDLYEIVQNRSMETFAKYNIKLDALEREDFLAANIPAMFILSPGWLVDHWQRIGPTFLEPAPNRLAILLDAELDPVIHSARLDSAHLDGDMEIGDLLDEFISALISSSINDDLLACLKEQIKMSYHLPKQFTGNNIIALLYLSQQASETQAFSTQVFTRHEELVAINIGSPRHILDIKNFLADLDKHIADVQQTFNQVLESVPEHSMGLTIQKALEKVAKNIQNVEARLLIANQKGFQKAPPDLQSAFLNLSHSLGHLSRRLGDLLKQSSSAVFALDP